MQEYSHAHACVSAAILGQILIAPVKSTDVNSGRVLALFRKQMKIIVYYTKLLLVKTCQRKGESTQTESEFTMGHPKTCN